MISDARYINSHQRTMRTQQPPRLIMPAHGAHELELLRSDGDPRSWPPVADPDTGQRDYHVMTKLDEEASVQWRVKIGDSHCEVS